MPMHMSVCMHACMHACMHVCMYVLCMYAQLLHSLSRCGSLPLGAHTHSYDNGWLVDFARRAMKAEAQKVKMTAFYHEGPQPTGLRIGALRERLCHHRPDSRVWTHGILLSPKTHSVYRGGSDKAPQGPPVQEDGVAGLNSDGGLEPAGTFQPKPGQHFGATGDGQRRLRSQN